MNLTPAVRPGTIAGTPAQPEGKVCLIEIRLEDGKLIKRVAPAAAKQLVSRGWAEWRATGERRHLCLTADAPLSSLNHGWGGRDGTRPMRSSGTMRSDGTGLRNAGQLLGARRSHREHTLGP
jgi:hypothetical protein